MFNLEHIEQNPDLENLLDPKKRVHDLVIKVNGSMLAFHKEVKTLQEIETLAEDFFKAKREILSIKSKSRDINLERIAEKLNKMKSMRSDDIDFI